MYSFVDDPVRYIHIAVQTPTQPTPRSVAKLWIGTTHRGRRETMSNATMKDRPPSNIPWRCDPRFVLPKPPLMFFRKIFFFQRTPTRASPTSNNSSCRAPRPTNQTPWRCAKRCSFRSSAKSASNLKNDRESTRPTRESRKAPYGNNPLGTLEYTAFYIVKRVCLI